MHYSRFFARPYITAVANTSEEKALVSEDMMMCGESTYDLLYKPPAVDKQFDIKYNEPVCENRSVADFYKSFTGKDWANLESRVNIVLPYTHGRNRSPIVEKFRRYFGDVINILIQLNCGRKAIVYQFGGSSIARTSWWSPSVVNTLSLKYYNEYLDGKPHGRSMVIDGMTIVGYSRYRHGKPHGHFVEFDNGSIKKVITAPKISSIKIANPGYMLNRRFSGYYSFKGRRSGYLRSFVNYKNGVFHGVYFNTGRHLTQSRVKHKHAVRYGHNMIYTTFDHGVISGRYIAYGRDIDKSSFEDHQLYEKLGPDYSIGKICAADSVSIGDYYEFLRGELHGKCVSFFPSGLLSSVDEYLDGVHISSVGYNPDTGKVSYRLNREQLLQRRRYAEKRDKLLKEFGDDNVPLFFESVYGMGPDEVLGDILDDA